MRKHLIVCTLSLLTFVSSAVRAVDPPRPETVRYRIALDLIDCTSDENRITTRGAQLQTLVGYDAMSRSRNASHILFVQVTPLESVDGVIRTKVVAQVTETTAPEYDLSHDPREVIWQSISIQLIRVGESIQVSLGGVPFRYHGSCLMTAIDEDAAD